MGWGRKGEGQGRGEEAKVGVGSRGSAKVKDESRGQETGVWLGAVDDRRGRRKREQFERRVVYVG